MRTYLLLSLLLLMLGMWTGCQQNETPDEPATATPLLQATWELLENKLDENGGFMARFTLYNTGTAPLSADWALYYSQTPRAVDTTSLPAGYRIEQISGDWFRLQPGPDYTALAAGDSAVIEYHNSLFLIKEAEAPSGAYVVWADGTTQAIDLRIEPFTRENQSQRGGGDRTPYPTAARRYATNEALALLPAADVPLIIPRPVRLDRSGGSFTLRDGVTITLDAELNVAANYLRDWLTPLLGASPTLLTGSPDTATIELRIGSLGHASPEAYELTVHDAGIRIQGNSAAGVFYGIQSLRALADPTLPVPKKAELVFPTVQVVDYPRFGYRGMHLDVSRNFHRKDAVLKLLDLMSFYKLNKFHFHLTDDEGWRLAIPGLPELTDVGARRGHTLNESNRLHPSYGSGPDDSFPGSGHYSRQDYIDIVRYAHARHIEVIPEFDLPGHARAAIKSMEVRYRHYAEAGDTAAAERYLLTDPNDRSVYKSVQHYDDNVVSVCRESTYDFLAKVVDEVQAMHEVAGAPLQTLHTGGDEVPNGVWTAATDCRQLIAEQPALDDTDPALRKGKLSEYFLRRFHKILQERGLRTAGWEEIALRKIPDANGNLQWAPNPDFVDENFLPYVWNNLWGAQDWAYRLANAGYDVVLCDVTNLYFDLAYDKHPTEPGLYWGGFVDTRKAFEFIPYDVFKSTYVDAMGNPLPLEDYRGTTETLRADAREHILGIQGQLWSETVINDTLMEYYLFPKLLGLAERAWAPAADWEAIEHTPTRMAALDADWAVFANALGQRELPRLNYWASPVEYRIPPPGAVIRESLLYANVAFPGLTIRYTTDGSEPTPTSTEYTDPVEVTAGQVYRLRTFDMRGRGSRVVLVE